MVGRIQSKNSRVTKTSNGKIMLLPKRAVCNGKISRFIKQQEEIGLWNQLGFRTLLSKVPLSGDIVFSEYEK